MPGVHLNGYTRVCGAGTIATAKRVRNEMEKLAESFPSGLEYGVLYDTTVFVEESI